MRLIFKTEMFICQSKRNLEVKILFGKITQHLDLEMREVPERSCCMETRIPSSILVHDLTAIES